MLSVFNTSFPVSRDLIVVAGLKLIEEDTRFKSRIGISFNSEKVIFSPVEFKTFIIICNSEIEYEGFVNVNECDVRLVNHEIMINVTNKTKEIIVKSKITWNTVRINENQFKRIIDLMPCIEEYIKIADSHIGYADFCYNKLISDTQRHMDAVLSESRKLYNECLDVKLMMPEPPKAKEFDVRLELVKNLSDDRMLNEIALFYDSQIIQKVLRNLCN